MRRNRVNREPSPTASHSVNLAATNNSNNSAAPSRPPSRLPNPPALIEYKSMRFLIMDAPSDSNLSLYLQEMQSHGVTDVVRVCEPTYARDLLDQLGIRLHDWIFPDGECPPDSIVDGWLELVRQRFTNDESATCCIAVHCVAGLGRAPLLVAIALIEAGMAPLDAVAFIRERRRGAINTRQLKWIEVYRPRRARAQETKCVIM